MTDWGDHGTGALYGALLALVAGQLGPQVGIPEELITVPLGAAVGGIVGGKRIAKAIPI